MRRTLSVSCLAVVLSFTVLALDGTGPKFGAEDEPAPKPVEVFNDTGIRFKCLPGMLLKHDADADASTWEISSSDDRFWLNISRFNEIVKDPEAAIKARLDRVMKTLVRPDAKVSDTSMLLGSREVKGKRLAFRLHGTAITQDYFYVVSGPTTVSLIVQDLPDRDGSISEQTAAQLKLLKETFEEYKFENKPKVFHEAGMRFSCLPNVRVKYDKHDSCGQWILNTADSNLFLIIVRFNIPAEDHEKVVLSLAEDCKKRSADPLATIADISLALDGRTLRGKRVQQASGNYTDHFVFEADRTTITLMVQVAPRKDGSLADDVEKQLKMLKELKFVKKE